MAQPQVNGNRKTLPRFVPGTLKDPETIEVNLPGIGASVVIRQPTVGAYLAIQQQKLGDDEESIALAAVSLVEPEMTADEFREAIKSWPLSDWFALGRAVNETMGTDKETLAIAQREFRGPDQ